MEANSKESEEINELSPYLRCSGALSLLLAGDGLTGRAWGVGGSVTGGAGVREATHTDGQADIAAPHRQTDPEPGRAAPRTGPAAQSAGGLCLCGVG